jgi:hypothetical protein
LPLKLPQEAFEKPPAAPAGKSRLRLFGEFFWFPDELVFAEFGAEIIGHILEVIHKLAVLRFQIHIADRIYCAN